MVWTGLSFLVDANNMFKVPADYTCEQFNCGHMLTHDHNFVSVFLRFFKLVNICLISAILEGQIEGQLGFSSTPRAHMILI